jgi:GPCR proteolysis site, GPS, motif
VSLDRGEQGRSAASDLTFTVDGVPVEVEDLDASMPIIIRVPAPADYLAEIDDPAEITAVCQFQMPDSSDWDPTGCEFIGLLDGYFLCHCYHLTSFSALFGIGNGASSGMDTLDWIALGLVSGAVLVCATVMVTYHAYRKRKLARSRASIRSKLSGHSKRSASASSARTAV